MNEPMKVVSTRDRFLYVPKGEEKTIGQKNMEEKLRVKEDKRRIKVEKMNTKKESVQEVTKMVLTPTLEQALFNAWRLSLLKVERGGARNALVNRAYLAGLTKGTECVPDCRPE